MKRWMGALGPALALLLALPAGASTFLAMSPADLVAASDAVVTGSVIKVESFRDTSGRIIVTEAMVEVEETVLGETPTVVVLRTVGGTVDGYTVVAHGFPTFEIGDKMLVFLSHQADGSSEVTGYRLGHYRLLVNRHGDEIAVPTLEPGVQLLTRDGAVAPRPQAMRVDAFKQMIRGEAERLNRAVGF